MTAKAAQQIQPGDIVVTKKDKRSARVISTPNSRHAITGSAIIFELEYISSGRKIWKNYRQIDA